MNFIYHEKKGMFSRSGGPSSGSLEGRAFGHYVVRRLIGRGATGAVYLAEDQRLPRQVALKILLSESLSQADAKMAAHLFEREARAIALLNHPNILPLFDFGQESSEGMMLFYLVTPFCREGSLKEWLQHRTGGVLLSPQELLPLLEQAADALEYAHSQGLVHCDVKPSNFLIRIQRVTSDQPNLLLADFGVARLAQATVTASQALCGTPVYMSPEQWRGQPVPASDQYALASMAYELLTGSSPFQGTLERLMYSHLTTPPQPPSTIAQHLPSALDPVIMQALAKQPEARFPSMTAFVEAFHQAIPTAEPPGRQLASTSWPVPSEAITNQAVQPSSPAGTRETPRLMNTPFLQAGEIHVTLHLSASEARAGGERTLLLPNGQQAKVTVPAGASDGQVIRLPKYLEPSSPLAQTKDLVVTIAVAPSAGSVGAALSQPSISHLAHPSISEPASIQAIAGHSPSRITWKTLSLIGLVLLLLLIGVIALLPGLGTTTNGLNATATAQAGNATIQTIEGTASAATATANAQATVSAQASATASMTANPYPAGMSKLELSESLASNSSSQWDVNRSCAFTKDGYDVHGQDTSVQMCLAHNTHFDDFTFEVQMKILRGAGGGILFRVGSTAYYFHIGVDGYYALLACAGTNCSTLISRTFSSEITQDLKQANVLAVVANRQHIDLYANQARITGIDDSRSLHGQIGVVADGGSEVMFSNARVWTRR